MGLPKVILKKTYVPMCEIQKTYDEVNPGQIFQSESKYWLKPEQKGPSKEMLVNLFTGEIVHLSWIHLKFSNFKPISHAEILW
ncbi:MAG: hypothetical protein ACRBB6_04335 [Neptuniibacter sp.]